MATGKPSCCPAPDGGGGCFAGLSECLGQLRPGTGKPERDVVVIVGPSGVGKSTLIKRLMTEFDGRFGFSTSNTTRQPRPGEKDGVHYHFTTKEAMQDKIKAGAFIEHAEVVGNFYGTSFEAVEEVVSSGRICLLDIDVQGAEQVKRSVLHKTAAYIFLVPPSLQSLEERLRSRGTESEEKIQVRLASAVKELKFSEDNKGFFDKKMVNGNLEVAYKEFRGFMRRSCGSRMTGQDNGNGESSNNGSSSPGWTLLRSLTPRSPWSPRN